MASRKRKPGKQARLQLPKTLKTANELFLDAMIRHQIGLLRLSKTQGRKIKSILDATERDLRRAIHDHIARGANLDSPSGVRRLQNLLDEIRKIRAPSYAELAKTYQADMTALSLAEPKFMAMITETVAPVILNTTLPSPKLLRAIVKTHPFQGRTMRQWSRKISVDDLARIEAQINIGMVQGESSAQISRRVVGSVKLRGTDGVTQITRNNADAISRTAVNAISNQSRQAFVQENKDIFTFELYIATLDGQTTPVCRSLDGKRFRIGEGAFPPLHMNCRSLRTPILDNRILGSRPMKAVTERGLLREFTKQERITGVTKRVNLPRGTKGPFDKFARTRTRELVGTVPAKTTYQEWLGTQSNQFQADVLGKTKAKLFRDGGLKLDKFVNNSGKEFTLSRLALDEASAFRAAGLDPKQFL